MVECLLKAFCRCTFPAVALKKLNLGGTDRSLAGGRPRVRK